MQNQIKALRTKRGWTQAELAEKVALTQQQMQRIEAGIQEPKLEIACKLAAALGVALDGAFPGTRKAARIARKAIAGGKEPINDEVIDALDDAGIETVPQRYTFKFRLRNVRVKFFFRQVSKRDYDRLRACFSSKTNGPTSKADRSDPFIVFDSNGYRCALNHTCVSFGQFLFDPMYPPMAEEPEHQKRIRVFMADGSPMMAFGSDTPPADDKEDVDSWSDMEGLMYDLETVTADYGEEDGGVGAVFFTDEDGERVYLNCRDVALIEVPLLRLEHEIYEAWLAEGDDPTPDDDVDIAPGPGWEVLGDEPDHRSGGDTIVTESEYRASQLRGHPEWAQAGEVIQMPMPMPAGPVDGLSDEKEPPA